MGRRVRTSPVPSVLLLHGDVFAGQRGGVRDEAPRRRRQGQGGWRGGERDRQGAARVYADGHGTVGAAGIVLVFKHLFDFVKKKGYAFRRLGTEAPGGKLCCVHTFK